MYSSYSDCANLASNFSGFHNSFLTWSCLWLLGCQRTFLCNFYIYDLHSNFCCLAVVDYISSEMQLNTDFVWLLCYVNQVFISIILQTQLAGILHYFYSVLLYVSAVHFSHHLVGHMLTKRVQGRGVSVQRVGVKLV
jgi:hypothetical protein